MAVAAFAAIGLLIGPAAAQEDLRPILTPPPPLDVPAELPDVKLQLNGIELTGNSVFAEGDLKPLYSNLLQQKIAIRQVYEIADRITQYYFEQGFVLARAVVPPQNVRGGVFSIEVQEGTVGEVEFAGTGASAFAASAFGRSMSEKANADLPFRSSQLDRVLLLAQDVGAFDLEVYTNAQPSSDGMAQLVIQAMEKDRFEFDASSTWSGSKPVGPLLHDLRASVRGLTGPEGLTSFSYSGSLPELDERVSFGFYHLQYLGGDGLSLTVQGGISRSQPGSATSATPAEHLHSDSDNYSIALSYPFLRTRETIVTGYTSLTYLDSMETSSIFDTVFKDKVRTLRGGLSYQYSGERGSVSKVDATITNGVDIFDASQSGDILLSRTGANPTSGSARVEVSHNERIGDRIGLMIAGLGQYGFASLLSSQECSIGGQTFGRAYRSSEAVGDHCATGTVELTHDLPGVETRVPFLSTGAVYVFIEGGWVGNTDAATSAQLGDESLVSLGTGLRLQASTLGNLDIGIGRKLWSSAEPRAGDDGDYRLLFSLRGHTSF